MSMRGARYLHVLVPCPLGWGSDAGDTVRLARLAHADGLFPVFEAEHGDGHRACRRSGAACRSRTTCACRRRYAHLFGRRGRPDVVAALQAQADRDDRPLRAGRRGGVMNDKPFAITLDPGSSLANHTGTWRTERARLRRRAAAVRQRLPRRRGRAELAVRRRERRRVRGGLAPHHARQPVPGRSWAASATTRARPPATAATRRGGRHQLRRALPR